MPENNETNNELNNKAQNFFHYLKHIAQLRTPAVRNCQQYVDVLWFDSIPKEKECYCYAWAENAADDNDSAWIEIQKPHFPSCPTVPDEVLPWIDLKEVKNSKAVPQLKAKILNPEWTPDSEQENQEPPVPEFLMLENFLDVVRIWNEYFQHKWVPWAAEYNRQESVQEIYTRLFSMYQQQQGLGESYEVILALGLLVWKTPSGQQVNRHILTGQARIHFDPNKGEITVQQHIEGIKFQVEDDMLEPNERPLVEIQLQLQKQLREIETNTWHDGMILGILRSWIQSLDAKGQFVEDWKHSAGPEDIPKLYFAPAIILRKRTSRGYVRFIDEIVQQIDAEGEVPRSVKMYIDICEDKFDDIDVEINPFPKEHPVPEGQVVHVDGQIHFPLPANEEQFNIVKKFRNHLGILVQGPPGTGKSHTITNLICHLLAIGKRVLVTSQTTRALKVLKEKIPEQVKGLTVNLLGFGVEDFQNLEQSVGEITRKYNAWDSLQNAEQIKKAEQELINIQKDLQKVRHALQEIREVEIYKHSLFDHYQGTAQHIAQILASEEDQFGWIQDSIAYQSAPTLSALELKEYLRLAKDLNADRVESCMRFIVAIEEIPSNEEFVQMLTDIKKCQQKVDLMNKDLEQCAFVTQFHKAPQEKRRAALTAMNQLLVAYNEATRRPLKWIEDAVHQILGEQDQPLKELQSRTRELIDRLKPYVQRADEAHVKIPEQFDLYQIKAAAEDIHSHLANGKKLGSRLFLPKNIRKALKDLTEVRINGRNCSRSEEVEILLSICEAQIFLGQLKTAWSGKYEGASGTYSHQTAEFAEHLEALNVIVGLEQFKDKAHQSILDLELNVIPRWQDRCDVERFFSALEAVQSLDALHIIEKKFEETDKRLKSALSQGNPHTVHNDLLKALQTDDWQLWGRAWMTLKELSDDRNRLKRKAELLSKIQKELPSTLEHINETLWDEVWNDRVDIFNKAWKWSQVDAWLNDFWKQHDEYDLHCQLESLEKKLSKVTANLTALKAWRHCFERMTIEQRHHMIAWSTCIKKIGKGTGKYAEKHRRDAQHNMEKAQKAIPVWIMPLYRVVENFTPEQSLFDVVIVDEASQCGPEALFLQYIAKQCIIVGDNEQIAPDGVGIDRESIDLLRQRFLGDIPLSETFDISNSLFTHAQIRYGNKITLKEHFRCVPEIIQFSNDLCYAPLGTSLIPLRQYPPNRLDPVKTFFVSEGFREGSGQRVINRPEADAIVQQIVECCAKKEYQGKSMGVITLQGSKQAQDIQILLTKALGPEEIQNRKLLCGNAYDFQGDERDIIFLSMVTANNERFAALVKETDKRRFNVAASRAKDQMWLFHSVTLNDLNQNCFRYKLLSYCQNPSRDEADVDDSIFESKFQRDVYDQIIRKGYRVIPEFRVAQYRIDLVIEGMEGRLAVECDGDEWHGPEQYDADMNRQRILERAGWIFWRIRGSEYYRDPDQALEGLWQKLSDMGIESKIRKPLEAHPKESSSLEIQDAGVASDGEDEPVLSSAAISKENELKVDRKVLMTAILKLLEESSQGEDLLADKVIRSLRIPVRGSNRNVIKKRIHRIISELKRDGTIVSYETNKRTRFRANHLNNGSELF